MKYKRVLVTGSLAYDHIMSMPGKFADHILPDKLHILNVSFIMQTFRREFGGTGGNIAYSLALLRIPTVLYGAAGSDFGPYAKHLTALPGLINRVKVWPSEVTATGFVITDRDDNQIWGFYQGAMPRSVEISLRKDFKAGDFLVIAPNDPPSMLHYVKEAIAAQVPYLFDPAFNIPHFSLTDLKRAINNCYILIGNDYEIELISKRLKTKKEHLVSSRQILITTLGRRGSKIYFAGKSYSIPAAKPLDVSDPTGAGDAYRAGFLAGLFSDLPVETCGRMGSLASVYTVEKYGTQTHKYTASSFKKRFLNSFPS